MRYIRNATGKRALYISIQNQHIVPTESQTVLPLRTGYEGVLPYRVEGKYAVHATEKGTVVKVTRTQVVIQYGTRKQKYLLPTTVSKDTGGIAYKHVTMTTLREGDTVDVGDNITYDSAFFGPDMFNRKRVAYKTGTLANIVVAESQEVYEDSSAVSNDFAKKLRTPIVYVRSIVTEMNNTILEIKKIGNKVSYHDHLLVFKTPVDDTLDVDLDKKSQSILAELNNTAPKAKAKGTLLKIEIVYNPDENLKTSKTVQQIIDEADKRLADGTGKVDSTYSIKGKALMPGTMEIKFYITKDLTMGLGDKLIVANQLKSTVGKVFSKIQTESGREIDMKFGKKSIDDRIVVSPYLQGTTNLLLEEITKKVVEAYEA